MEAVIDFKLQLHWLIHLLLVHNGIAASFIVGSLIRDRKVDGVSGWVVGNLTAVSISTLHEGLLLGMAGPASELSVGDFLWALLVYEFFYYWIHRISHVVPFIWYLVHHYLHRSTTFGVHLATFASLGHKFICYSLNIYLLCLCTHVPLLWSFYIGAAGFGLTFLCHSRVLSRISLGPLEYVLMTPAAHAVHGPSAMKRPDLRFSVRVEPLTRRSAFAYSFGGEMVLWQQFRAWQRAEAAARNPK